jgi:acyl-ACP thioesterase
VPWMSPAEPAGVLRSTEIPPLPGSRVFETSRPVRLGDADATGRLRLDALARHLQDVATDDYTAAGLGDEPVVWVVRRAAFRILRWPRYLERVSYATFCGGIGRQWAERRTAGRGDAGGHVEAAVLWAALDSRSGRLSALPAGFATTWGVGARRVSARLQLDAPPPEAGGRPWALRSTDLDVLGHVNNACHWEAVEDELARVLPGRIPVAAECEYPLPLDRGDAVRVVSAVAQPRPPAQSNVLHLWLVSERGVHAAVEVRTEPAD